MSDFYNRDVDERGLDTVLAEDFSFEGELKFSDSLMIKGPFRGDIRASGDLYIGVQAVVEAHIEAVVVHVKGHVIGNIVASRRIELSATARVDGDLNAPELVVEAGAQFNGICTMAYPGGAA